MWNFDRYSFRISLVFVAATLLSSCLSAPAQEPWWYRPCDTNLNRIRHSRSTGEDFPFLKNQLTIFIPRLRASKKKIDALYGIGKDQQSKSKLAKLPWLKLRKMQQKIRKSKDKKVEEFYNALQQFAGTLEVLRSLKVDTKVKDFNQEKRESIYNNISDQMRLLLCEVQENFKMKSLKVPPGIPLKKMKIPKFPQPLDLTDGHLIDVTFFTKTSSFFKRTQKLLFPAKARKVKKSKSAGKSRRT